MLAKRRQCFWLQALFQIAGYREKESLKAISLNKMFVLSHSNSTINKNALDLFLVAEGRRNILC